ncbi:MAG: M17 family metallopeptidase [Pseudorhodoplanes sp.]
MRGLKSKESGRTIPIHVVGLADFPAWLDRQPAGLKAWLRDVDFKSKHGAHAVLPGSDGLSGVLLCLGSDSLWSWADLAATLPRGDYAIATDLGENAATAAALGWSLGTYDFSGFRAKPRREEFPNLVVPAAANADAVQAMIEADTLGRDLINRPANDLGPAELADSAERLARDHGAKCQVIPKQRLIAERFPAVFTVGHGSPREPRLIDMRWGDPKHPRVTLVGKGVCFDTGGLTIKSEAWMRNMKKDMGGAATVLALAHLVMHHGLPVNLRVLIPAVENSTSGEAYRPGDIVKTRKGLTIEVANTDAEGRVILADALAAADEEAPAILIDVSTLTGAARAGLGPEIGAFFCDDDAASRELDEASEAAQDPLWRLPLWKNYRKRIDSSVGDILNLAPNDTAGAITAALLKKDFVEKSRIWIHLDVFCWNDTGSPGRPVGGEPTGLRALFRFLARRYPAA